MTIVKRNRLRSGLATLALLIVAGVAWFYLAPTTIGGSIPLRGHKRGEHGAAVPHGRSRDRAARLELPGRRDRRLLEHAAPHRGASPHHRQGRQLRMYSRETTTTSSTLSVLPALSSSASCGCMCHTSAGCSTCCTRKVAAALLCAVVGLLTLFGVKENGRRRRRRRKGATGSGRRGIPIVNSPRDQRPFNFGALLTASAVAAVAFLVLGLIAFTRPASQAVPATTPYSQQVQFGYSAHVRPGLVYPNGTVTTGDPIFLTLVRDVAVSIDYRSTAARRPRSPGPRTCSFSSPVRAGGAATSCSSLPPTSPATTPAPR